MVDLFSTSLMDDVELMWFPSTGERLWLKEASHHKCKSETSLCLEPLPFDSTPSALFVTVCWHNIIQMLLSCERKALSQRKPEMLAWVWTFLDVSGDFSRRGREGGLRPLSKGLAQCFVEIMQARGHSVTQPQILIGSWDPQQGLSWHPLHKIPWDLGIPDHCSGSPGYYAVTKDLKNTPTRIC